MILVSVVCRPAGHKKFNLVSDIMSLSALFTDIESSNIVLCLILLFILDIEQSDHLCNFLMLGGRGVSSKVWAWTLFFIPCKDFVFWKFGQYSHMRVDRKVQCILELIAFQKQQHHNWNSFIFGLADFVGKESGKFEIPFAFWAGLTTGGRN